jgi:hypothetical protein
MAMRSERRGSCKCGQVSYVVTGDPTRIGICHCTDCRVESGSAFTYFGIWPIDQFTSAGETTVFEGRRFCPSCGSRMFAYDETEAEIKLGSLSDAPTDLVPVYELWVKRREPWLAPIGGARQFEEDRA